MAQSLGTAIEQVAAVGTPSPLAAALPSRSAGDAAAQQPQAQPPTAVKVATPTAVTATAKTNGSAPPPPSTQAVIDTINAQFLSAGKSLELSVDVQSNRSVVIIRDTQTGRIVGQFPTEQVLRMQALLGNDSHLLIDLTA